MKKSNGRSSANGRASSNGHSKSSSNGKASGRSTSRSTSSQASSSREGLEKVMKNGLKDIYYAEKQLVKALNKMSKAAENEELKQAFETHKAETEEQVTRLEEAFEELGIRAAGKKCPAMDGLIEEGAEAIEEFDKGPARDAALIVSAQKVEHYEIAAYGSLRAFAATLGYATCEQIFDEILEQESNTDEVLNGVAQTINELAAQEDENMVDEEELEEA
jgi:ferritin-like metal-binding protein YciE